MYRRIATNTINDEELVGRVDIHKLNKARVIVDSRYRPLSGSLDSFEVKVPEPIHNCFGFSVAEFSYSDLQVNVSPALGNRIIITNSSGAGINDITVPTGAWTLQQLSQYIIANFTTNIANFAITDLGNTVRFSATVNFRLLLNNPNFTLRNQFGFPAFPSPDIIGIQSYFTPNKPAFTFEPIIGLSSDTLSNNLYRTLSNSDNKSVSISLRGNLVFSDMNIPTSSINPYNMTDMIQVSPDFRFCGLRTITNFDMYLTTLNGSRLSTTLNPNGKWYAVLIFFCE